MKKEVLVGLIVALVIFGGYFIFNQSGKSTTELNEIPGVKEFDVVAKQWEFLPSTINVNLGDTVILNVESVDVAHGISIPAFGVNEKLGVGEKIRIEFIADKEGNFPFACTVFCGTGHSGMVGSIVVSQ